MSDVFVGQWDIVVTLATKADLSDTPTVAMEIKKPKILFVALAYDDSATIKFTDESNKANGLDDNDLTLLPTGPIQIGDIYYWGTTGKHTGINLDISREGVGSWVLIWEYSDTPTTWAALTNLTDETTGFTIRGTNSITFDLPADWSLTSVDDSEALYFIRARVTTADASPTTQPLGQIVNLSPISVEGTIVNVTAVSGDDDFGKFTATIPEGALEHEGTYFLQAKITPSTGLFYGKTATLQVKKLFGQ